MLLLRALPCARRLGRCAGRCRHVLRCVLGLPLRCLGRLLGGLGDLLRGGLDSRLGLFCHLLAGIGCLRGRTLERGPGLGCRLLARARSDPGRRTSLGARCFAHLGPWAHRRLGRRQDLDHGIQGQVRQAALRRGGGHRELVVAGGLRRAIGDLGLAVAFDRAGLGGPLEGVELEIVGLVGDLDVDGLVGGDRRVRWHETGQPGRRRLFAAGRERDQRGHDSRPLPQTTHGSTHLTPSLLAYPGLLAC